VLAIIRIPHFGQDGLCVVLGMAAHTPTISRGLRKVLREDISHVD
jgi:hypothetical protein